MVSNSFCQTLLALPNLCSPLSLHGQWDISAGTGLLILTHCSQSAFLHVFDLSENGNTILSVAQARNLRVSHNSCPCFTSYPEHYRLFLKSSVLWTPLSIPTVFSSHSILYSHIASVISYSPLLWTGFSRCGHRDLLRLLISLCCSPAWDTWMAVPLEEKANCLSQLRRHFWIWLNLTSFTSFHNSPFNLSPFSSTLLGIGNVFPLPLYIM